MTEFSFSGECIPWILLPCLGLVSCKRKFMKCPVELSVWSSIQCEEKLKPTEQICQAYNKPITISIKHLFPIFPGSNELSVQSKEWNL